MSEGKALPVNLGSGVPGSRMAIDCTATAVEHDIEPLTASVVSSREELKTYASEWDTLLESSRARSLFLTWEWLDSWLKSVRPDAALLVVLVRDGGGRLAAIAPFYRTRMRLAGIVGYRSLRVVGDSDSGADYPDMILRADCERQAAEAVAGALVQHSRQWDCLWLSSMAGWTGAPERFEIMRKAAGMYLHERPRTFSSLQLPTSYQEYLESLSGKFRSWIRRRTRQLSAAHKLEFVRCDAREELPAWLDRLFELHSRRWASVGLRGSFERRPRMADFYRTFAPVAMERGWLRFYALRLDGQVLATQYGYAYGGSFLAIQEGFEPSAPEGVGNLLRSLAVEACIAEGLREYDFLGGFTFHKGRWGAQERGGHDLFLGRPTLKNRLLFCRKVWPSGRYIRES
jgi:CelD/BcsL family acetyltransferase involved in cellulose biosynthesis